jgi:RimJ/RimL family protein N-acetyltransferase
MITLAPIAPEHAPSIQALVEGDREILAQTRLPDPYPPDGAASWIAYALPRHERGEELSFAIVTDAGEVIGACGLVVSEDRKAAELGYWIGRAYRGQGHATTAVRAALQHAFAVAGLKRVFALPLATNAPSRRVLEKAGFRLLGLQPAEARWAGQEQALYEITR